MYSSSLGLVLFTPQTNFDLLFVFKLRSTQMTGLKKKKKSVISSVRAKRTSGQINERKQTSKKSRMKNPLSKLSSTNQ